MSEAVASHDPVASDDAITGHDWRQLFIPIMSVMGLLVSGYLTWIHWSHSAALCSGVGDCEVVNSSEYADVAGIPIALFGFCMYAAILGLSIYRSRVSMAVESSLVLAVFGISLAGVLYSAYLTYLELAVIHAICPWCVTSAVLITIIFAASLRDVMRMTGES